MKIHIVRLVTFTWCLVILFSCIVFVVNGFMAERRSNIEIPSILLLGVSGGFILSYIPLVFLGIAPSVILESLMEEPDIKKGLVLNTNSWHGDNFLLISCMYDRTLCRHCWTTPFRLGVTIVMSYAFFLVIPPIVVILFAIKLLAIIGLTIPIYIKGYRYKSWKLVFEEFIKIRFNFIQYTFLSEPRKPITIKPIMARKVEIYKPCWFIEKIWSISEFVVDFFSKSWNIIVTLKNKACPRIHWK